MECYIENDIDSNIVTQTVKESHTITQTETESNVESSRYVKKSLKRDDVRNRCCRARK